LAFACIDVGSNTTRLLVAELRDGRLRELYTERVFTRIGKSLLDHGEVEPAKVAEHALVAASQVGTARELGSIGIDVVGTAVVRQAPNAADLVAAVEETCGLPMRILEAHEEARLSFAGAVATHDTRVDGTLAVLDVGGWSTEVALGTATGGITWWESFALGSGLLADLHLRSDPPDPEDIENVRTHVEEVLHGLDLSQVECAIAVGGAAGSLRRLVGRDLVPERLERCLEILLANRSADVAAHVDLHQERVRLMPAGVIVVQELVRRLAVPLELGRGGLREGVVMELARAAQ
jgi:exopolyphosphatase / guanosine-5'-triphosphate,3'-diphosphate pyrophosphatase